MTTALPAIPEFDEREPTEAERLNLMSDHCHDLLAENQKLERDNRSLRVRARTMYRAMNDQAGRSLAVVGVFGRGHTVDRIIRSAQTAESLGEVPAVRFLRDGAGEIIGVELALLERPRAWDTDEGCDPAFQTLARLALGMAVVGEDA